jgi:hypothetical protein
MGEASKDRDMVDERFELFASCLNDLLGRPALSIALRQRAKFEGWLKIELAHALEDRGASVSLEAGVPGTRYRADVRATLPGPEEAYIMLKTVNTNFRFSGISSLTRPITKNIRGVIEDVSKLRASASEAPRLVIFPVFPVAAGIPIRELQLKRYITRIKSSGGSIEREGFLTPSGSDGSWGIAWFIARV